MLTLTYSANIYTSNKNFIGKAVVLSNTKTVALLAVDEDVFREICVDVIVEFFDEVKGIVTSTCILSNFKEPLFVNESYTCTCQIVNILDVLQRRKDVYARLNIDIDMHQVKSVKRYLNDKSIHLDEKKFKANLKNISVGGMYFESTKKILKGSYVAFYLENLISNENNIVIAEILRVELTNDINDEENKDDNKEPEIYGYGCRFIDLTRSVESNLRQFVFAENRKQLLKRKM